MHQLRAGAVLFFVIFLLVVLFSVTPRFAIAQAATSTSQDVQAIIKSLIEMVAALQAQVEELKAQLAETQSELGVETPPAETAVTSSPPSTVTTPQETFPTIVRNLTRGSSGDDVRALQAFLARDRNIYPEGLVTGYFGPLTEAALKRWQEKHGVETAGVVGPKTRAKFVELGHGRIQELLTDGAGSSGVIPPGLQRSSGAQMLMATTSTATTSPPISGASTSTATTATTTPIIVPTPTPVAIPTTTSSPAPTQTTTPQTTATTSAQKTTTSTTSSNTATTAQSSGSTATTTYSMYANSACVLSESSAYNPQSYNDPDSGVRYAMLKKPGVTYPAIKDECSDVEFDALLTTFCSINSGSTRTGFITYDSNNKLNTVGCPASGCKTLSCSATTSTATTTATTVIIAPSGPPPLPTNIVAYPDAAYGIIVKFDYDNTGRGESCITYKIYRSTSSTGSFTEWKTSTCANQGSSYMSFIDSQVNSGQTYRYYIVASQNGQNSESSAIISAAMIDLCPAMTITLPKTNFVRPETIQATYACSDGAAVKFYEFRTNPSIGYTFGPYTTPHQTTHYSSNLESGTYTLTACLDYKYGDRCDKVGATTQFTVSAVSSATASTTSLTYRNQLALIAEALKQMLARLADLGR